MPNLTPLLGLTYPSPSESADVAYWLQQLAQNVEAALATPWTSYTPVLGAETTAPNLGAVSGLQGQIVGAYKQIGKTLMVRGQLQLGAGFTLGTGRWLIGLPVVGSTQQTFKDVSTTFLGAAYLNPANAANFGIGGFVTPSASGSQFYLFGPTGAGAVACAGIGGSGAQGGAGGVSFAQGGLARWAFTVDVA